MNLERLLEQFFGFTSFRLGQKEVISSILEGKHTLAMLPTGSGKSLCYQLPTYILKKPTLIVSPLLSLMQDQAEQLKQSGEKRVLTFNSFLTNQQKRNAVKQLLSYRFIFVSPEMLALDYVIKEIRKIGIGLFVIDEAHCISQWGYDFRPDYLNLGEARIQLGNPLTLALTATATKNVRNDIIEKLRITNASQVVSTVDRHNITLLVEKMSTFEEKLEKLFSLINQFSGSGIIYFSSKKATESVCDYLQSRGLRSISYYHGAMEQDQRMLIQQQFISGQLRIICATSAFGMGVNKSDVRFVIHFHLPSTMEAYVQEIGRAGRDSKQSIAVLLYSTGDEGLPLHLLEQQLPIDAQIEGMYSNIVSSDIELTKLSITEKEQLAERFSLNEIQFRILSQMIGTRPYTLSKMDSVKEYCRIRRNGNRLKLDQFLSWIQSSECRRVGIMKYFEENHNLKNPVCCDNCGETVEASIAHLPKEQLKENLMYSDWKQVLASMLLISKNE